VNLKELVSDPAWLFDLGFSVRKWKGGQADPQHPDSWSLGAAYRIPAFQELSNKERPGTFAMAWSQHAILMEVGWEHALPMSSPMPNVQLDFYIDTRCSRGIHRANAHCHYFQFRWRQDFFKAVTSDVMVVRPLVISRAKAYPGYPNVGQVRGWITATEKQILLKLMIPYESLSGCDPVEFPEWSVMSLVTDGRKRFSLARHMSTVPFDDPSLWCCARLVEA
jgi:hypothetical protein